MGEVWALMGEDWAFMGEVWALMGDVWRVFQLILSTQRPQRRSQRKIPMHVAE